MQQLAIKNDNQQIKSRNYKTQIQRKEEEEEEIRKSYMINKISIINYEKYRFLYTNLN